MVSNSKKIILDCDPGHDDAIAILMALKSSKIDLMGITTVCGNSPIDNTTKNALRVLEFVDRTDIPVAKGCYKPLTRKLEIGKADGESGLDGSSYLPEPKTNIHAKHAVDFMADIIRKSDEPITIIPTGPLTNIAFFIMKYPELVSKIKKVVLMGGVFYRRNKYITPTEFNIYCDPEAANIVVNSDIDITMVGLDVTMQVLVEEEQFAEFRKINNDVGELVMDWLKFYEKLHRETMGVGGALHDPLALAVLIDPTLIKTNEVYIDIETKGKYTLGATVVDFWGERNKAPNVNIAEEVEVSSFFKLLYSLLKKY